MESYLLSLDSQLLAGIDILANAKKPSKEEIQAYGKRMLDTQIGDWTAHLEKMESTVEEVPGNIYMVLKLAQSALLARGIIRLGAREVCAEFSRQFEEEIAAIVSEACELKIEWNAVKADTGRLEAFAQRMMRFPGLL